MKRVQSDEELQELHRIGKGLIYNDFSGMGSAGSDYNVLHAADCTWIARTNTNVAKYFFNDVEEAIEWLR